ncbi:RNA-binding S4 domain-containing protein [Streptococcus sp. DD13]|uniref:RNA-binding S4 domain-containing protein n=1 Tax=Streptococcus sp. DD13 TaxID=1777881 RepID=UPI00079B01EA|nr:RNA-binding S4 domain-containing protein [Streptococcus sp. DD13]KXT77764.1 hypothetical protein STRDD13_01278 [Streptococcus sp. DD13]
MLEFKLFEDYITLQSLLKELRIIQSGGAVKPFLATTEVLLNNEPENRRGKKIRARDIVSIPSLDIKISVLAPTQEERAEKELEIAEQERVKNLVKQMNKSSKIKNGKKNSHEKKVVRFPGR